MTETSYAGLNAKADALIQALIDRVEDHGRSHELKRRSSPGTPPPLAEASPNLEAPEMASPAPPVRRMTVVPPPASRAGEGAPRRDGRSARRSGRTLQFATRVSPEFDNRLRAVAERDGKLLVEALEDALEAYEQSRQQK